MLALYLAKTLLVAIVCIPSDPANCWILNYTSCEFETFMAGMGPSFECTGCNQNPATLQWRCDLSDNDDERQAIADPTGWVTTPTLSGSGRDSALSFDVVCGQRKKCDVTCLANPLNGTPECWLRNIPGWDYYIHSGAVFGEDCGEAND